MKTAPTHTLFTRLQSEPTLTISKTTYTITGYKDSSTTNRPLGKLTLEHDDQPSLLEFQFYPPYRIIHWHEISDQLAPDAEITYQGRTFTQTDSGISDIQKASGEGQKYLNHKIHWYDYEDSSGNMLSLGRFDNTDQWENLYGEVVGMEELE